MKRILKAIVLIPPSKYAKNVARDLLWGCWCSGKRIASAEFPNTSALQLCTILKKAGAKTRYVDAPTESMSVSDVENVVGSFKPDFIFFPTATMTFNDDAEIARNLKKKYSGAKTVCYGSHPTFYPKKCLADKGIDFIMTHEHEGTAKEFIEATVRTERPSFSKIKGLGFKKGKEAGIVITKKRDFTTELDSLPIADRKPILKYSYFNPLVKKINWTTMITSKGCPARCNFCTTPRFYGNTWRGMSAERVIKEMEYLASLGYKEIFFRDETFTGSIRRTDEICNLLIKKGLNKKLTWICSSRVTTLRNEEQVRLMKKAGCHMLRFGVESGDNQILRNINKGATVELTRKVFKWCKKAGMETHAHTMLGCVGETWETVNKTIKFIKEIDPTTVTCGAYTPYPGTPLFDDVLKKKTDIGDGTSADTSRVHTKGYYSGVFCDLSEEEVGKAVKKLYKSFYLRPSYILKTLFRIRSIGVLRRTLTAGVETLSFALSKDK